LISLQYFHSIVELQSWENQLFI